jgi:hypothetical protein
MTIVADYVRQLARRFQRRVLCWPEFSICDDCVELAQSIFARDSDSQGNQSRYQ